MTTYRKRDHHVTVRLTEDERHTLDLLTSQCGVGIGELLRSNLTLFRPYLTLRGCKDRKYLDTLAQAVLHPSPLTIQQLDDEKSDVMDNEQDAIKRMEGDILC